MNKEPSPLNTCADIQLKERNSRILSSPLIPNLSEIAMVFLAKFRKEIKTPLGFVSVPDVKKIEAVSSVSLTGNPKSSFETLSSFSKKLSGMHLDKDPRGKVSKSKLVSGRMEIFSYSTSLGAILSKI